MVFSRLREISDREPSWRKLEDKVDTIGHDIRNAPGQRLKRKFPQFERRNIGGGMAVGSVEAAIAIVLKETVGVPFGSDVEIVESEALGNRRTKYTVNVDAPFQNMAEAEAFFESGTGFTSLVTDLIQVEDTKVLKHRTLRDTYQIEVVVED